MKKIRPHQGDDSARNQRFHGGLLTPKEKALLDEMLENFGGALRKRNLKKIKPFFPLKCQ